MHIETQAATSAVAITMGLWDNAPQNVMDMLHDWSEGMVENYAALGELAAKSCLMANEIAHLPGLDFPGVYAYEVDEELGRYIRSLILSDELAGKGLDDPLIMSKLAELAYTFFNKSEDENYPALKVQEIILKYTGVQV